MNIGDKVRVINWGAAYDTYDRMFKQLGFRDTKYNCIRDFENEICTIFNTGTHPDFGSPLLALRHSDGRELLIEERGIVLVSKAEHKLFKLL